MKAYLDTSVIVPMFVVDNQTARAEACVPGLQGTTSTWVRAEFASAIGVKHRAGVITASELRNVEAGFVSWLRTLEPPHAVENADILAAEELIRRRELKLRTPDALHLAIVQRLRVPLLTFDTTMADAAVALGLTLVPA